MECLGICPDLRVQLTGSEICSDFFLIELNNVDVVMGITWLQTLGPITWNFQTPTMSFAMGEKKYTLQGLSTSELHLSSPKQLSRLLLHEGQGMLLQIQLLPAEVSKSQPKKLPNEEHQRQRICFSSSPKSFKCRKDHHLIECMIIKFQLSKDQHQWLLDYIGILIFKKER